jgi:hypothetical protein
MDENVKKEEELEDLDGPRQAAHKQKIIDEGIQKEEELLEKEDTLYEA